MFTCENIEDIPEAIDALENDGIILLSAHRPLARKVGTLIQEHFAEDFSEEGNRIIVEERPVKNEGYHHFAYDHKMYDIHDPILDRLLEQAVINKSNSYLVK